MPYSFDNATVLNYSIKKEYLGEGLASFNTIKNLSIKGIFDSRSDNSDARGVKESYVKMSGMLENNSGQYEDIIINNYNLGRGRVLKINFDSQNPVRIGEYNCDIEILENSDFSNYSGDKYGSFISGIKDKINAFNESLNFNYSQDKYDYDHSIEIEYLETGNDSIDKAKIFASGIFNDSLNLGIFGKFSGYHNTLKTRKNLFTESYNLINNNCRFTKKIEIDTNYTGGSYSHSFDHSLSFDELGKITITEKGKIKSLERTDDFTSSGNLEVEISGSLNRCNAIFNSYKSLSSASFLTSNEVSLFSKAVSLTRNFNKFENACEYSVSYMNDPKFVDNLILERSIEENLTNNGIIQYNENGEFFKIGRLGSVSSTDINVIKNRMSNIETQILSGYKIINRNFNFNYFDAYTGNSITYSIDATNDPAILVNDLDFKSLKVNILNNKEYDIYGEYVIPNFPRKSVFLLNGDQINLSSKSVNIEGVLNRPNENIWTNQISLPLDRLKSELVLHGLQNIPTDAYIEAVNLNHNSNYEFNLSLVLKYVEPTGNLETITNYID